MDQLLTSESQLLADLDCMLAGPSRALTPTGALLINALAEVCTPGAAQNPAGRDFWRPYLTGEQSIVDFFADWLGGHPASANPGYYLDFWFELSSTSSGDQLATDAAAFGAWFERFLDLLCGGMDTAATWTSHPTPTLTPHELN